MPEPKAYMSIAELSEQIPYSQQAIRCMMTRGDLRFGEHYFRIGRRVVFKWATIVTWIERTEPAIPAAAPAPAPGDVVALYARGGSR